MSTPDTWLHCRYVAIDVEGTASPRRHPEELVELAAVEFALDGRMGRTLHTLLDPGRPISIFGTRAHGLRDEDVAGQPPIASICPQLRDLLDGTAIVAHNAQVDWRLLHRDCPSLAPLGVVDTLRLSRALWPEVKRHSLDAVMDRLRVDAIMTAELRPGPLSANQVSRKLRSGRHTALYDATATAHAFVAMVRTAQERGLQVSKLVAAAVLPGSTPASPRDAQMVLFTDGSRGPLPDE